jgi:hypothetical protein
LDHRCPKILLVKMGHFLAVFHNSPGSFSWEMLCQAATSLRKGHRNVLFRRFVEFFGHWIHGCWWPSVSSSMVWYLFVLCMLLQNIYIYYGL